LENLISTAQREDAIDWFTKELARDPSRAEHLKQALRRKIGLPLEPVMRTVQPARAFEDPDEYWDNVPV
jgi:hypothetical protein